LADARAASVRRLAAALTTRSAPVHRFHRVVEATRNAPLPLIIGITGHRDLRPEDVPFLEGLVRATFVDIQEQHLNTPLVLLSPLAEGGDRLVARIALEMGIRLVVPVPMPLEVYEQDFETPESREEFRELLAAADWRLEMPIVEGNSEEAIRDPGPQRNRQYAMVGAFIARQSQIFIALWDGVEQAPGTKQGGTAEIIRFRLEGAPVPFDPPRSPLTLSDSGPVYHIVTPRLNDPLVSGEAFTRRNLVPAHRTDESFHRLYEQMDVFNRDAAAHADLLAREVTESKKQLLHAGPSGGVSEPALPAAARTTLEQYAVADGLALQFAQRTLRASAALFFWVFVAAACFTIFKSFPHTSHDAPHTFAEQLLAVPWFLVFFLATFFFCAQVLHRRAAEGDYQNKYQDYRALAEGLRIQFFWRVAGVEESVADHYLRKQRGELEWIRSALRSWDVTAQAQAAGAPPSAMDEVARLELVRRRWVEEQRNYFASKAHREQEKLEADERAVERMLKLSVGLAAAFAVVLILPIFIHVAPLEAAKHWVENYWVHGAIMAAIIMLAIGAGLRHGYSQQLARSEHAKQYSRMSELFDTGVRRLDEYLRKQDYDGARALLRELGQEALEENGDWVLLHRERPLEVPHAG
jgi:hypothetical protein